MALGLFQSIEQGECQNTRCLEARFGVLVDTQPLVTQDRLQRPCSLRVQALQTIQIDQSYYMQSNISQSIESCSLYASPFYIYIKDLILFRLTKEALGQLKQQLIELFEKIDLGEISLLLGIQLRQGSRAIAINQAHYIRALLQ